MANVIHLCASRLLQVLVILVLVSAAAGHLLAGEPDAEPAPEATDPEAADQVAADLEADRAKQLAALTEGLGPNCTTMLTHVVEACAHAPQAAQPACDAWLEGFEGYKAAPDAAEPACEAALPAIKQSTAVWAEAAEAAEKAEQAEQATE